MNIEKLIDNAATAAQERELLRKDSGEETVLREAVRLNVADPLIAYAEDLINTLRGLIATKYADEQLRLLDRGIGTNTPEGVLWLAARTSVRDALSRTRT